MNPSGDIILIDKPYEWTSFDVVRLLKKPLLEAKRKTLPPEEAIHLKKFKVGHAGTLDPLATGLLVICTGPFTKKIGEIQAQEKEYTGTIVLGGRTASFDLETPVEVVADPSGISNESIHAAAKSMEGRQMQVPPVHSAVKHEGKRAYESARKGIDIELKAKEILIHAFEIKKIEMPEVKFRIICSRGTYIRAIANTLGDMLGCGGYLSSLCRTRIGNYLLRDAVGPLEFKAQLADKQQV